MTRQPKNEAFARTSFLQGANAAYIEEMQAQYERNPGSVSDEWRHFFASLQEDQSGDGNGHDGPSWAKPLEQIEQEGDRELLGALTGDYGETEQHVRGRLQARASAAGVGRRSARLAAPQCAKRRARCSTGPRSAALAAR